MKAGLTGDSLLTTVKGLKAANQIVIGDEVLTHQGNYLPIRQVNQHQSPGEIITLYRARSNIPVSLLPHQEVFAVRHEICSYDDRRCLPRVCRYHKQGKHLDCPHYAKHYHVEQIPAKELKTGDFIFYPNTTYTAAPDFLYIPIRKHFNSNPIPDKVAVSPDLMEWIGYFAAEGFVDRYSVNFANYEDAEQIANIGKNLFGLKGTINTKFNYRTKRIRFNSGSLSRWMEGLIGRGAANKKLPEWVLGVSPLNRQALLRALMRSDGSFRRDKPNDNAFSYRYGSASPTLSHQIMRLLQLEGIGSTFEVAYPKQEGRNINGTPIKVNHPSYRICVYDAVSVNRLLDATREADNYKEDIIRQPYDTYPFQNGWLYTLKKIEFKNSVSSVFNFETEADKSFTTSTFTLAN